MSLRDGVEVKTYEDLVKEQVTVLLYETIGSRCFTYNTMFDIPGMTDIETGEHYYGTDIKKYIQFPLHHVRLVPFTQEEMDAS